MRRRSRQDANHGEIVRLIRACGASVQDLSAVGGGCPDLLVGFRGRNYLLEVKDGGKRPSQRKKTPAQIAWHRLWAGSLATVGSAKDALDHLGISLVATDGLEE